MSGKAFFDTNVMVYLFTNDDARADKAEVLVSKGGVISIQVLNEFVAVAHRKLKTPWPEIHQGLGMIRRSVDNISPLTTETHDRALGIAQRYSLTIYDSLIVASALDAECDVLYSEDMQDGMRIDGLTIRNPFRVQ